MVKHSRGRKRSRDHRVSLLLYDVTRTSYTVAGSPASTGAYPHSATAIVGEHSVMSDVVTSNFFDLINQKYDVSNACNKSSSNELYEGRSDAHFDFHGYTTYDHSVPASATISWEGEGVFGVSQPVHSLQPPSYILNDINDARLYTLQQAYSRASSASFNGSLFGAEALKTARMLVKPMRSAVSLVRRIKSKRDKLLTNGSSPVKALTGSWLEYRYGWKPFMSDISDLVGALSKSPRIPHEDLVARAGYDRTFSDSVPWVNPIQPGDITFGGTTFIDWQARVRSSVRYRIEDDSYSTFLTQSLGLGLDTLPATVWELVPFSFVADWFMGFGQWLDTIVPKPYIKILSNSSSVHSTRRIIDKMEYIEVDSLGRSIWPRQVKRQHIGRKFTGVYSSYDRSVNMPIPLVPLRTPGTLNLVHSVDSVALLYQIFLGELRSLKKF